jgi:hypothetical protein
MLGLSLRGGPTHTPRQTPSRPERPGCGSCKVQMQGLEKAVETSTFRLKTPEAITGMPAAQRGPLVSCVRSVMECCGSHGSSRTWVPSTRPTATGAKYIAFDVCMAAHEHIYRPVEASPQVLAINPQRAAMGCESSKPYDDNHHHNANAAKHRPAATHGQATTHKGGAKNGQAATQRGSAKNGPAAPHRGSAKNGQAAPHGGGARNGQAAPHKDVARQKHAAAVRIRLVYRSGSPMLRAQLQAGGNAKGQQRPPAKRGRA